MKLYLRKKTSYFNNDFLGVAEENGILKYDLKTSILLGKKTIRILDTNKNEVAVIKPEIKSVLPKVSIYVNKEKVMEIKKEFSLKPKYTLTGYNWEVNPQLMLHNYIVTENGRSVVYVQSTDMRWGDALEIEIADAKDELLAVALCVAIDAAIEEPPVELRPRND